MAVDTSRVTGRRLLHFHSLDDVLADAERLAAGRTVQLGNWSLGQICKHLATVMNRSVDPTTLELPWVVRLLIRVIGPTLKKRVFARGMKPGFQLPRGIARDYVAKEETSTEEGLAALRAAVHRLKSDPRREGESPFGRLTPEEWDRIHMRHAELHLSFVAPVEE